MKLRIKKLRVGSRGRVYQAAVLDMDRPVGRRVVFSAIQLGWNKSTRGQCESYIKAVVHTTQIEMIHRKFGYFPRVFRILGKEHEVTSVTRCWTTGTSKQAKRHYFDVVCGDGNFQLYQDLESNTWHVVSATDIKAVQHDPVA